MSLLGRDGRAPQVRPVYDLPVPPCPHLQAVVAELTARGCTRSSGWVPHRNGLIATVFLAPRTEAQDLARSAPAWLRAGGPSGCCRAPHSHIACACPAGAYQIVVLAEERER